MRVPDALEQTPAFRHAFGKAFELMRSAGVDAARAHNAATMSARIVALEIVHAESKPDRVEMVGTAWGAFPLERR